MRIVFFDLETAGLSAEHPTIQIGAIATDNFQEVDAIEAKLTFDAAAADPHALELNHHDPQLWSATAVSEASAVARFSQFL